MTLNFKLTKHTEDTYSLSTKNNLVLYKCYKNSRKVFILAHKINYGYFDYVTTELTAQDILNFDKRLEKHVKK